MKTIYLAAAMASALSLSAPASAEFFNFTMAPLLGVSAGQASFDVSCPAASSCDDTDTAWRVFGGLEVNEYSFDGSRLLVSGQGRDQRRDRVRPKPMA